MDRPFERIVVPTDGSALADRALHPALELARPAGTPIMLVRVVDDVDAEAVGAFAQLERLVDGSGGDPVVDTRLAETAGSVAATIVAEAASDRALICMASHGRSGLGHLLLGSVAEAVLRICADPVLVVGPSVDPEWRPRGGRLVVCLDGSDRSEGVLPASVAWSAAFGLPLWLVTVGAPTTAEAVPGALSGDVLEGGYLEALAERLPVEANWDTYHSDDPADEIVSITGRDRVDMLALATHGRTGWARVAAGSVAMHVVHRAPCPALLVRPRFLANGDEGPTPS